MKINFFVTFIIVFINKLINCSDKDIGEDRHGVKLASKCEAIELKARFKETDKREVLETGYKLDTKNKIYYEKSELRLTEVMEDPHICERMWQYQLHKERKDSTRFARGTPQTFDTLKKLSARGVQIKMDVPESLWDQPTAETSSLYKQCAPMVSKFEEVIEDWYFNHQDQDLTNFLCVENVLKDEYNGCLNETYVAEPEKSESSKPEL